MLEKILVLLERFVAAHESIADSLRNTAVITSNQEVGVTITAPAQNAAIVTNAKKSEVTEAEQAEEEEKPAPVKTRRARTTKAKEDPAIDVKALRAEVLEIDDALTDGDIEDALDEFDDLMDEYSAKTLKDIKEADLPEFLVKARKIVAKYYDEK